MDVEESPQPSPTNKKGGKAKHKRMSLPYLAQMNPQFQQTNFKDQLEKAFKDNQDLDHDFGCSLYTDPFKACVLKNFIKDQKFLDGLRDELLHDQIFHEKNNDLYKFQQSDDLKKMSSPHAKVLRKLFQEDVCDWMQEVTGIALDKKIALTCSRYDYTDILLCHDDELDTRRIAFILYLVPTGWRAEDGGALDLFDMDEQLQPNKVVRSLVPAWNTFSWFEVTEASHHQVAEVLCPDKTRLSINGWFHGRPPPRPQRYIQPPRPLVPYVPIEEEEFLEWINPIYLDPEVQGQIQEKFEEDSEIELQEFLREDKYAAVMKALTEEKICWVHQKPPNKRNYHNASGDSMPEVLRQCLRFLMSEPFFLTLSNLTGLGLHELAPESDAEEEEDEGEGPATDAIMEEAGEDEEDEQEEEEEASESCAAAVEEKSNPKHKRRKLNSDCGKGENSSKEGEPKAKKERNPRCHGELRRWQHGDYTLVHDTDAEDGQFALDAMLFCGCAGWQMECGGYTAYIAKGEDEELLTVCPSENSLALVYRDKDTLRFVKHINRRIEDVQGSSHFYDFSVIYYE